MKLFLKTTDPNSLLQGGLIIQYPDIDTGYANDRRKRLAEIYLKNLITAVKATGGDFMIFYIPISQEVERFRESHTRFNEETAINEIVKAQGEVLWSLTPVIAASGEPVEKLYFKEDGHWTALGHALAARYMSETINDRLAHRKD